MWARSRCRHSRGRSPSRLAESAAARSLRHAVRSLSLSFVMTGLLSQVIGFSKVLLVPERSSCAHGIEHIAYRQTRHSGGAFIFCKHRVLGIWNVAVKAV